MVINMCREIIHAAGNIYKLPVGEALTHFFDGAVDIAQVRFYFFDGFAAEGNYQVQYTVGGRVLGTHIDHQVAFGAAYGFIEYVCFAVQC